MLRKILTTTLLTLLLLPTLAFAQMTIPKAGTLPGPSFDFTTEQGKQAAKDFLPKSFAPSLTKMFIAFGAVMAFFGLLIAGIRYIMAYGREGEISGAKTMAMWSLIGLVICIFSYAIVSVVIQIKLT